LLKYLSYTSIIFLAYQNNIFVQRNKHMSFSVSIKREKPGVEGEPKASFLNEAK
jgi:hypothetical protein